MRINMAGVAGSLVSDCGPTAGDLRAGGRAGGGIRGSERGSGETESCPELSLLPNRRLLLPKGRAFGSPWSWVRPLRTSSELMFKRDFFRVWGRTEGDCCFFARAEKALVDDVPRRCFLVNPGDDGADETGRAVSAGEGINPMSDIWAAGKG